MDSIAIKATTRGDFGKGAARKIRATNRIPATIYRDGQTPTHVSFDAHELRLVYQKSNNPNTVLAIEVDGETVHAILRDAQKHPVSRALLHADFYQVLDGVDVVVEVPVRAVGRAQGITQGGQLRLLRRTVRMRCAPAHIPALLEVDVSPMNINDFVRASSLTPPANCTLLYDHDYNLITIDGRRAALEAAEAAEAAAAEEAEGLAEAEGAED